MTGRAEPVEQQLVGGAPVLPLNIAPEARNDGCQPLERVLLAFYLLKEFVHLCLLSKCDEDVVDDALATTL